MSRPRRPPEHRRRFGNAGRRSIGFGLIVPLLAIAGCAGPERVIPNQNRTPAGTLTGNVLTLALETRRGTWYPDGDEGPPLVIEAFAEVGRPMENPGPLIRVPTGVSIRVSIHNRLDSTLVIYGLHSRPGSPGDTIQVAPGRRREVSFSAGAPGTYFYWATTTHRGVADRNGLDSQLHGALIVDPVGPVPSDRVFVLGSWTGAPDSNGLTPDLRVINGLSWPHTEALGYSVGDTVRWRWVNPTDSPHPMHLHGFYFDVTDRGTWAADTTVAPADPHRVVTELPQPGGTFAMRWVPEEPGNWLFHCHVAYHTSIFLSARLVPDPADPITIDPMHGMHGMVMALTIKPGTATARRPGLVAGARPIRLIAQAGPRPADPRGLEKLAFVSQEGPNAPSADSIPSPSSLLVLRRGEPVRVTIVNRLRAATAVHWHGIEVPAYSDGVANWSGAGTHLAPAIAPGDSFVAAFTPPRSGTFIYHAHVNESFQVTLGLYGALLVVDSGRYDPARERLIVLGSAGLPGARGARINGKLEPDTLRLTAGVTYRLRLIQIIPDWNVDLALVGDQGVVAWRPLAKDGAELPASAREPRPARLMAGPGETMDFEFRPATPGLLRLDVRQRTGIWSTHLPIRVDAAPARH